MSPRKLLAEIPASVWAITALFTLILLGWSILTPLGSAPDETVHADLIIHIADEGGYPDFDGRHPGAGATLAPQNRGPEQLTPELAIPRGKRPTFEQAGGDSAMPWLNQMPQHPPLYYWMTAAELRTAELIVPGSDGPLDQTWHGLRLFNVAMVAPLPLLAWGAARRLRLGLTAALAAAVAPLAVPQLTHIGSTINNDNLLTLLGAGLAVLVAGVICGDQRRSTAGWIALVTGLALLTKTFAFALLAWVAIVYAYRFFTDDDRRRTLGSAAIALVPAVVAGAVFPLQNLVRHGQLFPSTANAAFSTSPEGFSPDLGWYGPHFVTSIVSRFWGNFGYFDAPLPPAAVLIASGVTVALVVAAFWSPAGNRSHLALFAVPLPLLLVMVMYRAFSLYASSGQAVFIQGRYLFAAIVPFAAIAGTGAVRLLGRRAPLAMLISAGAIQTIAFWVILRTWWSTPGRSLQTSLAAVDRWSPWPSPVLWLLTVAIIAASLAALVLVDREPAIGADSVDDVARD